MKIKYLLGMVLIFAAFNAYAEETLLNNESLLWLEYGRQINGKNGAVTQVLYINHGRYPKNSVDTANFDELTAFYRVKDQSSNKDAIYYRAEIQKIDGKPALKIKACQTALFEVFVRGTIARQSFLAQTSLIMFGHCSEKEKREPLGRQDEFPFFSLVSPIYNYWPQTGQTFKFVFNPADSAVADATVMVADGNRIVKKIDLSPLNFDYTPLHDRKLNQKGYDACKENILFVKQGGGESFCKTAYTLLLHRSRTAFFNLSSGVALFFLTIIVVSSITLIRRRKFKYRW
ncbi:MAG: hypothetical protein GY737_20480 [Desulfobacteraceae bacterium]|nr:hypothetical protein [Desulfobacteraceae bacterium]